MKEGKVILYVVDISLYGSFLENWDVFTLDRKSASSIISEYKKVYVICRFRALSNVSGNDSNGWNQADSDRRSR